MKKPIFALVSIITIFFFFSSCTDNTKVIPGPGIDILKKGCSQILQEPILEPRYDCKGKRLPHDKFLGMREVGGVISANSIQNISNHELNERGYFYDENRKVTSVPIDDYEKFSKRCDEPVYPISNPSITYDSPPVFSGHTNPEWLLWNILPLLLLVLLILLIFSLLRNYRINNTVCQKQCNVPVANNCSITDAISKAVNNKQDVELILRIKNPISDPKNQKKIPDNTDNSDMD